MDNMGKIELFDWISDLQKRKQKVASDIVNKNKELCRLNHLIDTLTKHLKEAK